jgi:hypothetical protein
MVYYRREGTKVDMEEAGSGAYLPKVQFLAGRRRLNGAGKHFFKESMLAGLFQSFFIGKMPAESLGIISC